MSKKANLFQNAQKQLDEAQKVADVSPDFISLLKKPDNLIRKRITIKTDSGRSKTFMAFRSQHNRLLGPYKGGLRFHPQVDENEVKALSLFMSLKCSLVGLPYGGGKGGIKVDAKNLSPSELEKLSRAYVKAFSPYIGPWTDIPAPDVNTNPKVMAWMVDELESLYQKKKILSLNPRASFTGKPVEIGGSLGRKEATGRGGAIVTRELAKKKKWVPKKTTVAVQGFGNVGYWFARIASQMGFRIIALADSQGGVYNPKGIDPQKAMDCKKSSGSLSACSCQKKNCLLKNAKIISNEELLELKVDILAPAALENVINSDNAVKIKAKAIIELANGPLTPEADQIIHQKKIVNIPDILANAGGVIVSYFEWVQNLQSYYWEEEKVNLELDNKMSRIFNIFWHKYLEKKVEPRKVAYALALERLYQAHKLLSKKGPSFLRS